VSVPLKDFGRLAGDPRDHRVLTRIARARGITLQDLVREVLAAYVRKQIHDAKVVLGQDDDNEPATESSGRSTEDDGTQRSGKK
jgi:hypothetical protein